MLKDEPNQSEFIHVTKKKNKYKYNIKRNKDNLNIVKQLNQLRKSGKSINNTLYIPRGASVTTKVFKDQIFDDRLCY